MLTPEQRLLRDGRLTASRISTLINGSKEELLALWQEMVGQVDEEEIEANWAMSLGSTTEGLNLDWWAKRTGHPVIRRGEVVIGQHEWMACTLDGWDEIDMIPVEAKHVGGFEPPEVIIARYMPQMHWTMMVTRASKCGFSVIYGAKEPTREIIDLDEDFARTLMERAEKFMSYVWAFTPPVVMEPVKAPEPATIKYDMSQEKEANQWADSAATWLETKSASEKFDEAAKAIKGLVPADAKEASGFGIIVKRNKAGSLKIEKEKT